MTKTAIMQPYFLPYIGYWQLINAVDIFVVYDNIKFTKKGWFNRNRILEAGHDRRFTLPIKKDSDFLPVDQRYLGDDSQAQIDRTLRIIHSNYRRAKHFSRAYPVIEKCFQYPNKNLFEFIFNSIKLICSYLDIDTKIVISSDVKIDHSLKAGKKVIAICKAEGTTMYINTIGGIELYDAKEFASNGIDLKFIKSDAIEYQQFDDEFVPGLSILDIMMFNDKAQIKRMLEQYELI
jgi:hypothetical protein